MWRSHSTACSLDAVMNAWAVVAAAGVGMLGGALTGWIAARAQIQVAAEQASAELKRLQAAHVEEHLRNRQNTYHQLLDVEREWARLLIQRKKITPEQHAEWLVSYHHFNNGVVLFGSERVRAAAEALATTY